MLSAIWAGALAGYGIAIPVGAIAILIVETGLQRGFGTAFATGARAAVADPIYAAIAATAGAALAGLLSPAADAPRLVSGLVLVGLGLHRLVRLRRRPSTGSDSNAGANSAAPLSGTPLGTFAKFLGLTLLNPLTAAYFGALILSLRAGQPVSPEVWVAFVVGAALASVSWQSLLAVAGAMGHRRLSPRFRMLASAAGNLIIVAFGIRALLAN